MLDKKIISDLIKTTISNLAKNNCVISITMLQQKWPSWFSSGKLKTKPRNILREHGFIPVVGWAKSFKDLHKNDDK